MYPGAGTDKSLNHRKGFCSDGIAQIPESESAEDALPDWPQPQGIFSVGKHFNPERFLITVWDLYKRVVDGAVSDVPALA